MKKENIANPKISCIVPVYNVEKYLSECIESILSQTFSDFELILVDDGSPDGCGKICDEYAEKDSRVKVIHQQNKGVSAARNAGLNLASGEFVCFVDSDDWVDLDYMKIMYDTAMETAADMVVCGYREQILKNFFDEASELIPKEHCFVTNGKEKIVYDRKTFLEKFPRMRVDKNLFMALQSPCMRLVRRIQGDYLPGFNEKIKYGEDYLFNLSLYEKIKSICYIKPILYNYRYISGSAGKQVSEKSISDEIFVIAQTKTFFINYIDKSKISLFYKYEKKQYSTLIFGVCLSALKNNEKKLLKMTDLMQDKISYHDIFTSFFNLKRTVPLILCKFSCMKIVCLVVGVLVKISNLMLKRKGK